MFTPLKTLRGKQKLWQATPAGRYTKKHLKWHNTNAYIVFVYIPWLNSASWATDTCQYDASMQIFFSLLLENAKENKMSDTRELLCGLSLSTGIKLP